MRNKVRLEKKRGGGKIRNREQKMERSRNGGKRKRKMNRYTRQLGEKRETHEGRRKSS